MNDLAFDGFKGAVPLFTHKKTAEANLFIPVYVWSILGSKWGPWVEVGVVRHPRRIMG